MKAQSLKLYNFRNYKTEKINFGENVNIICGDNGMGKTNILEAVYYFSYGRSFRSNGSEIIREGEKESRIELLFSSGKREFEGAVKFYGGNKKKEIFLNEIELKRTSQLLGNFICVLFTPDEMNIVKGIPENRRKFCDSGIMVLRPGYVKELIKYRQIAAQKTALLKARRYETLPVWNEKMAQCGAFIMKMRESYIKRVEEKAAVLQKEISNSRENLSIVYHPSVKIGETKEETFKNFIEKSEISSEKEKENMMCLFGTHRDEIDIYINGKSAKSYASQGQIRTAVFCLKLAQMEIIKEETESYPVLLLDDILSELDKQRRDFLISRIKGKQIIITCTDIEKSFMSENANIIKIKDGQAVV